MKDLLPPEKPKHGGRPGKDNRMMLNGIFVLAEYRDPMAGPAGAVRPVEKRVHPGSADGASKVFRSTFLRN